MATTKKLTKKVQPIEPQTKAKGNELDKLRKEKEALQDEVLSYVKDIDELHDKFQDLSKKHKQIVTMDKNIDLAFKGATLLGITLILLTLGNISYIVVKK